jgi:hypothetical protein
MLLNTPWKDCADPKRRNDILLSDPMVRKEVKKNELIVS